MLNLIINELNDKLVRDNFVKLAETLDPNPFVDGQFKHFEITFTQAVTGLNIPHGLGFKPNDLIQTSKTGSGNITWNYTEFDEVNIDVTTDGACVVRVLLGRVSQTRSVAI